MVLIVTEQTKALNLVVILPKCDIRHQTVSKKLVTVKLKQQTKAYCFASWQPTEFFIMATVKP